MLWHLIQQWTALGARQIAVVCAGADQGIGTELDRLGFPASNRVLNPDPERGMFSSVQCAAGWDGWKPELTHLVVTLGDQPHLSETTLRTLLEFSAAHPDRICQPLRRGRRRHPVVLPTAAFNALQNTSAQNLKEFLERHAGECAGFESNDHGLDLDLDTPNDYERIKP